MNELPIEGAERESLLHLEIWVLDKNLFAQIRIPDIRPHELEDVEKDAEAHAICLIIDRLQQCWVIAHDPEGFYWRWAIGEAESLEPMKQAHKWLSKLQQVYLVRPRYRKVKGGKKK